MIRIIHFLPVLLTGLFLALPAYSQARLSGRVAAVIDGRTCVIDTDNGRITAAIQFIEVPEPEQPLSRIVRDHFERLVAGKEVTFVSNGFSPAALVGKLYVDGADMGLQLVRDGAAFHAPRDRSGQSPGEAEVYKSVERLAVAEKRGIWSITNFTPPWEFRAMKDKTLPDPGFIQAAARGAANDDTRNYTYSQSDPDMWVEVGGDAFVQRNPLGPLFTGFDAEKKIRNVATPSIAQVLVNGQRPVEAEVRVFYLQGEIQPRTTNTAFVLAVLLTSREHDLSKNTDLELTADGSLILVGPGQRFTRENPLTVQELVQYRISSSDLSKLAAAKQLSMKVGGFSGTVGDDLRRAVGQLLTAVK